MTVTLESAPRRPAGGYMQMVAFNVGPMHLALSIQHIQEINRNLDVVPVPHAAPTVRGLLNLRGKIVSVMDLHAILKMPPQPPTRESRNIIVSSQGEAIGLCVDRVLDTLSVTADQIEPPPSNVQGIDGGFFEGVLSLEEDVIAVIDLEQLLTTP
jgi:purine-binding chemotaxis protein CheW